MSTNKKIQPKQVKHSSSLKGQEIQKKTIFKPLLTNPYTKKNVWPRIEPSIQIDLLQTLESDVLTPLRAWNSFNKEEQKQEQAKGSDHNNIITRFNSLMKQLENQVQDNINRKDPENPIIMLFVCRYDIPCKLMYKHIPALCQLANVKLITLPKGSTKKLTKAVNNKHDIQFLALRKEIVDQNNFLKLTVDSTVDDIEIGFLENYKNQKLNMNVKYILTEMPIKKKEQKKDKAKTSS